MGKNDTPDTQTVTQSSEPPAYVKPYIEHSLGAARNLYENQGLYPSTGIPERTQMGYDMTAQTAMNPQLTDPSLSLANQTIGGEFLGADALRQASRAELDDVIGGTRSQFERSGRSHSGLSEYALGRGVTAAMAPAYQRERQLQQQAMALAPTLEQSRYMPGQAMSQVGNQQRGMEERFYQEPWDRLARYTGIALGNAPAQLAGGTSMSQQPIYQPSPWSQIAGLGMMGAGLFL